MITAERIHLALQASICATVVALGLRANVGDALCVLRRPRSLAKALLAMNLVMPAYAVAVAHMTGLRPAVAVVLVALAVSPVPPLIPGRATRAGGEPSYALGLLVASAAMAVVVVPVSLHCVALALDEPLIARSSEIARLVAMTVLAPLALGMTIRRVTPAFAERAAPWLTRVAMTVLVAILVPLVWVQWPTVAALVGDGTLAVLAGFVLLGTATGHLLGGKQPAERTVLAIATASRHPAIALTIAASSAVDRSASLAAILLYLAVNLLVSAPYAASSARRPSPAS